MDSAEFNALKVGDIIIERHAYENEQKWEVTMAYGDGKKGIMPILSYKERRAKGKKPGGRLLTGNEDIFFYHLP